MTGSAASTGGHGNLNAVPTWRADSYSYSARDPWALSLSYHDPGRASLSVGGTQLSCQRLALLEVAVRGLVCPPPRSRVPRLRARRLEHHHDHDGPYYVVVVM